MTQSTSEMKKIYDKTIKRLEDAQNEKWCKSCGHKLIGHEGWCYMFPKVMLGCSQYKQNNEPRQI